MWTITVNSATTAGMGKEKHHGDSRGRDGAQPVPSLWAAIFFFPSILCRLYETSQQRSTLNICRPCSTFRASNQEQNPTAKRGLDFIQLLSEQRNLFTIRHYFHAQDGKLWFPKPQTGRQVLISGKSKHQISRLSWLVWKKKKIPLHV